MKTCRRSLLSLALAVLLPACVRGQQTAPLPIGDLLDMREFGVFTPVQFSPDGQWVAYTARDNRKSSRYEISEYARNGVPSYANGTDIWIVNTVTHVARNLTGGEGANWCPAWSPDGRYLAFLSDRDNSKQAKVWVWKATTKVLRKLSDVPVRASKIEWMPNSEEVLTTILPENLTAEGFAKRVLSSGSSTREHQEDRLVEGSTVTIYKSIVQQGDDKEVNSDPWSLEGYLGDLALVDVATSSVRRLVRDIRVSKFVVSPSGADVAYSSPSRFEKPGSQQILWDLCVVSISSHQVRVLASNVRFDYDGASFTWSPDSSRLAYLTGGPLETKIGTSDCYLVDLKAGIARNVTMFAQQGLLYKQRSPLWDADGQFIYVIRDGSIWKTNVRQGKAHELVTIARHRVVELVAQGKNQLWSPDGGRSTVVLTLDSETKESGFYRVELENGEAEKLLENRQCYTCVNTDEHTSSSPNDKRIVYFSQDAQHHDDLWHADSGFRNPVRLTRLNPQFDEYKMGAVRLIDWLSDDGERLHGALLLPVGYQEGKRYPLIVWVYGGSSLSNLLDEFGLAGSGPFNMQLLATRGYAVLLPDSPGHVGTPMFDISKTVLPGVNKAIEIGIADADRLGVMGHSNGGYSTLALIVQTKRFKAAIEINGMGDLVGDYGEMDEAGIAFATSNLEHGQDALGGTPWETRERYIENSPIFFLDRIETPLLIVHGGDDTTVPPFLGDEIFVALRRLGKEVEYAKYKGEGHSPIYWSYANQVDLCSRIIAWFDHYLKMPAH